MYTGLIVDADGTVKKQTASDWGECLLTEYPGVRRVEMMVADVGVVVWMDQEGFLKNLPRNAAATTALSFPYDLLGPVAITGIDADLPEAWASRVIEASASINQ